MLIAAIILIIFLTGVGSELLAGLVDTEERISKWWFRGWIRPANDCTVSHIFEPF